MNVIEAAKAAGILPERDETFGKVYEVEEQQLERFAHVIRNQALEDAAALFHQPHVEYFGREIQDAIRAMQKDLQ